MKPVKDPHVTTKLLERIETGGSGEGGPANVDTLVGATDTGKAVVKAASAAAARTAIGAGTASTKADVGLGAVDNTSDAAKPISSAVAAALGGKAAIAHSHEWEDLVDPPDLLTSTDVVDAIEGMVSTAGLTGSYSDLSNKPTAATFGGLIVVIYDGDWPPRPVSAGPVMWISTAHVDAPRPTDMAIGDMWVQHPDALEAI